MPGAEQTEAPDPEPTILSTTLPLVTYRLQLASSPNDCGPVRAPGALSARSPPANGMPSLIERSSPVQRSA